ncbi:phospholipase-like protein [Tanacetum coccineum]
MKQAIAWYAPKKRSHSVAGRTDSWWKDLSRINSAIDIIWISDDLDIYLGKSGHLRCKFPWSKEVYVDRRFWESLVCLDPPRQGWLLDEHIDLWVDYMWHVRPNDANWAMTKADKVFIPINEPGQHWCLAEFDIVSGVVTFYDSGDNYDLECRDWYIWTRDCLQVRLPEVLELLNVFDKKGIAKNVEDPVQAALAYQERMAQFYYNHKVVKLLVSHEEFPIILDPEEDTPILGMYL